MSKLRCWGKRAVHGANNDAKYISCRAKRNKLLKVKECLNTLREFTHNHHESIRLPTPLSSFLLLHAIIFCSYSMQLPYILSLSTAAALLGVSCSSSMQDKCVAGELSEWVDAITSLSAFWLFKAPGWEKKTAHKGNKILGYCLLRRRKKPLLMELHIFHIYKTIMLAAAREFRNETGAQANLLSASWFISGNF
jgi:hypothetical protein